METSTGVMSMPEFLEEKEVDSWFKNEGSEVDWISKQIRTIIAESPRPMVWYLPSTYLIYSSMDSDSTRLSFSSRFLSFALAAK